MTLSFVKILLPWLVSFGFGILIAPIVINYLNRYQAWKKKPGNEKGMGDDNGTPIFNKMHKDRDVKTPRMGGLVIVLSVIITTLFFWLFSYAGAGDPSGVFDYLSRSQTWLPFAAFIAGGLMGFIDDYFTIKPNGLWKGGLPLQYRYIWVSLIAAGAAYWFYFKLGVESVFVPFYGDLFLGLLFIPFFMLVFVSVFSTSIIDGLDGLSGGIMAIVFAAMGVIAYTQNQIDISAFSLVIVGGILAFLWFNIPPARFYMTEVGYNALSFALVIIAFLTDTVILLPIIAFMLFITLAANVLQVLSKKIRGKKIFLVAPIHHHFEALGWPAHQVVMRYWIISLIAASLGVILALVS